MKYAIIKLDGKQFKVTEGQTLKVNRQPKSKQALQVLSYSNGGETFIGNPFLTDVQVKSTVLNEEKGKKVTIQRFKSKSRYRVKKGHRQPLTVLKIDQISKDGEAVAVKETKIKTAVVKPVKATPKTTKVAKVKEKAPENKSVVISKAKKIVKKESSVRP